VFLRYGSELADRCRCSGGAIVEYLEHYIYAEEMGIEGFMLNEHHNAPLCMQAKCNIFAAILAAVTKTAKIILLGNPLPLADNPVRLAEELSMIDMISKGRLVSDFVRGGGQEQLAAGVNQPTIASAFRSRMI
jgi:alkanesulfonate monooxygenase SsuD/methylene tetrahydromethanopterin reductase-like flavin-dependent oxidoreductase (luciferase family)